MEEVAQIEPLITSGVLRLTSLRPPLREVYRSTVLNVLGIDPDLGVFTNLVEQAAFIPESQKAAESICAFEIQKKCIKVSDLRSEDPTLALRQLNMWKGLRLP